MKTKRSQILGEFISQDSEEYNFNLGGIALAHQSSTHTEVRRTPISFPEDEFLAIQEYCQENDMKKAFFLKRAIKDYLERRNG